MATTTTKLGDFLGRALTNETPGTSNASDYLGRAVTGTDKDFMGRSLTDTPSFPPANVARNTAYSLGDVRRVPNVKEVQTLTATGSPTGNLKIDVTLRGQTLKTANIATVSQANVQSAIVALANVEPGDITVGGSGPWTLTFSESFGDAALAVADNAGLSGGTYAITESTKGVVKGGIVKATTAGTTHASTLITQPAVGATVTDGTAVWTRLK
jgi:hypothetical protein